MLPPIVHTCCGTPCFQEYLDQEDYPCWGNISCVDSEYIENPEGYDDEYRYGACEGHIEMYPSYDKLKYRKPDEK